MKLHSHNIKFLSEDIAEIAERNELVARALSYEVAYVHPSGFNDTVVDGKLTNFQPMTDDATAFKLLVKERLTVTNVPDDDNDDNGYIRVQYQSVNVRVDYAKDSDVAALLRWAVCQAVIELYA